MTIKGIDVSYAQGNIDWAKVKASGVSFAMIRACYGWDDDSQIDRYFRANVQGCEAVGLPYGLYHYSYAQTPEDAEKEGAELLQPTTDTVTYSDGLSDEVFGFDIPVPTLDEEFDLALIGKKGTWYDHKVSVSNPVPVEESGKTVDDLALADGTYTAELTFAGGSGKAYIQSPCTLTVADGKAVATVVWSSSKYDYMLVDGERYDVLTTEPGSTFEIPVAAFDTELTVIGDTTAMSTPHEIEYTLNFDSATLTAAE